MLRYAPDFPAFLRPDPQHRAGVSRVPAVLLEGGAAKLTAFAAAHPELIRSEDSPSERWALCTDITLREKNDDDDHDIPRRGDRSASAYLAYVAALEEVRHLVEDHKLAESIDALEDDDLPAAVALPSILNCAELIAVRRSLGMRADEIISAEYLHSAVFETPQHYTMPDRCLGESLTSYLVWILDHIGVAESEVVTAAGTIIAPILADLDAYPPSELRRFFEA